MGMVCLLACCCGCSGRPEGAVRLPIVRIDTVGVYGTPRTVQFPGCVRAAQEVNAAFKVGGTLRTIFAEEGEFVRRGAPLAARAAGAEVTHVDSVRQVVTWSRENMELSGLEGVRWIVEDALKFVRREVRRGSLYRGIILDPPAYGRGADGERWILEDNIGEMLECCAQLLEPRGAFLVLNLYSMGLSSTLARTAVRQAFGAPREEQWGELCFTDRAGKQLPLGTYYRFTR